MMDDKYVLFEVNGTTYGVPSVLVAHVEMVDHVTVVPNANAAVDGRSRKHADRRGDDARTEDPQEGGCRRRQEPVAGRRSS